MSNCDAGVLPASFDVDGSLGPPFPVTQLTSYFNPSPTADPRTRGSVRRASGFVQIAISLIHCWRTRFFWSCAADSCRRGRRRWLRRNTTTPASAVERKRRRSPPCRTARRTTERPAIECSCRQEAIRYPARIITRLASIDENRVFTHRGGRAPRTRRPGPTHSSRGPIHLGRRTAEGGCPHMNFCYSFGSTIPFWAWYLPLRSA